ncbi:Thiolase-like, partial [Parasponia andersonii]
MIDFHTRFDPFLYPYPGESGEQGIRLILDLNPYDTKSGRMMLLQFKNTSASNLWYELAYME